ncbi:MAG: hypothetical protein J6V40_00020, partial [Clostridia bacterium]|nr:hypothetical protein [Clostridia bacterium]
IIMNERELMKLSEKYDEDIKPYDFTVEELEELMDEKLSASEKRKKKYFEYYDDVKDKTLKKQDW